MLLRNIYNIVGIVKENVLFRNIENSILSESRDCFKFCIDLYLHVKSRQNIQFDISLLINRCMYVKDPFYLKYLFLLILINHLTQYANDSYQRVIDHLH